MNWENEFKPIIDGIEREAYKRGWDDAIASILRTLQHSPIPQQPSLAFHDAVPKSITMAAGTGKSVSTIVEAYIKDHPGQRGNAIVAFVASQMPERDKKSVDRTVRTAFLRLKNQEKIRSINGRWYHPEGAPEIPL